MNEKGPAPGDRPTRASGSRPLSQDAALFERAAALFEEARHLDDEGRAELVEARTEGAPELRALLERLLAHANGRIDFMAFPTNFEAGRIDLWATSASSAIASFGASARAAWGRCSKPSRTSPGGASP